MRFLVKNIRKYFLLIVIFTSIFESYSQLNIKQSIEKSLLNNSYLKAYKLNVDIEKFDEQTSSYRPNPIFNNQSIFISQQIFGFSKA